MSAKAYADADGRRSGLKRYSDSLTPCLRPAAGSVTIEGGATLGARSASRTAWAGELEAGSFLDHPLYLRTVRAERTDAASTEEAARGGVALGYLGDDGNPARAV